MSIGPPPGDLKNPLRAGAIHAVGAPAIGLFVALMGYGALTRGMGQEFIVMWWAVFTVWSMPALMTFSELAVSGAGMWAIFVAVLFSNLRNIPMVVTALPLVRAEPGIKWRDFVIAQLLSPTVWVHVLVQAPEMPKPPRRRFFTGFAVVIFAAALFGAWVGYAGIEAIPKSIGISILILTPLYLLLIMVSVRQLSGYLALGFGAVAVPWLMQWSVDWGLALGGIGAGTLGFLLGGGYKPRGRT